MLHTFHHLFPREPQNEGPHICADCAAAMAEEPQAEQRANMHAAIALGEALMDALDDYTEVHEETTYRHVFEALAYMHWRLQQERNEDDADA